MIKFAIGDKEIELRNTPGEIKLTEYELISAVVMNETLESIERYIEIFKILGLTEAQIDTMDIPEFLDLIKDYNTGSWEVATFQKEFTIDGKIYRAFTGDNYTLSVRDLSKIETFFKKNNHSYLGEMLAVIYKQTDVDSKLHYDDAHISGKAKLFRQHLHADIALPYVNILLKKVAPNVTSRNFS